LTPGILCKTVDLYVVEARTHFQMAVVFLLATENQKILFVPEKMKEIRLSCGLGGMNSQERWRKCNSLKKENILPMRSMTISSF